MSPRKSNAKKDEVSIETELLDSHAITGGEESAQPSPGESSVNLDSITDNLTSTMPEVQEHAIEEEQRQEDEKRSQWADLTDNKGNNFDPAIHRTDKEGNPSLSPKGKLMLKPGRKAGAVIGKKSVVSALPLVDEAEQKRQSARMAGIAMANSLITLGTLVGGEEWQPVKNDEYGVDEKNHLENAFSDYCETKNIDDFPPGIALTIAVSGYILPRFTMPKTKAKVTKSGNIIKKWWVNRKLKKHQLKAVDASSKENPDTDPKS